MKKWLFIFYWIIGGILTWLIFVKIFDFIFYDYPSFITYNFQHFTNAKTKDDFSFNIGTYGDMYGALNSFLSGLAFIGLLATLVIQIIIHLREKQHSELETLKTKQEKLIFFKNSLKHFIEEVNELKNNVNTWHDTVINLEHNQIYNFEESNIEYLFEILCKKIDIELYLTAYSEYFKDEDFLSTLHQVHKIETTYKTFLSLVNQSRQYFNDTNLSYNNLCINCILQIDNVLLKSEIAKLGNMNQIDRTELMKKISRESNGKDIGPQLFNIIIMLGRYEENKRVCLTYAKFLSQTLEVDKNKIEKTYEKINLAISKF